MYEARVQILASKGSPGTPTGLYITSGPFKRYRFAKGSARYKRHQEAFQFVQHHQTQRNGAKHRDLIQLGEAVLRRPLHPNETVKQRLLQGNDFSL